MTFTYADVALITELPPNLFKHNGLGTRALTELGVTFTYGGTGSGNRIRNLTAQEMLACSVSLGIEDMSKQCRRIIARRVLTGLVGRYIILIDGETCVVAQTLKHMLMLVQKHSGEGQVVAIVDLVRMAKTPEGQAIVERAILESRCA